MPDVELLSRLRGLIAGGECAAVADRQPVIRTGVTALDDALPFGGLERGSLVELLHADAGSGVETLAAVLAREVCRDRGALVVLDRGRQFYPPALVAWGLAPGSLLVVHPADEAEELWAADQALRSRAAAVVWLRRERLTPHDARRLRLAAGEGGAVGLLLRPARERGRPTWADVQLVVEPRPSAGGRRLRVEVARCRGGSAGRVIEIEFDDVSGAVREVPRRETLRLPAADELAGPAASRGAAGAARPGGADHPARRPAG